MFKVFKKQAVSPLSHPGMSVVRSETRALIKIANAVESRLAQAESFGGGPESVSRERKALAHAENALANSICAVVSSGFGVDTIARACLPQRMGPVSLNDGHRASRRPRIWP